MKIGRKKQKEEKTARMETTSMHAEEVRRCALGDKAGEARAVLDEAENRTNVHSPTPIGSNCGTMPLFLDEKVTGSINFDCNFIERLQPSGGLPAIPTADRGKRAYHIEYGFPSPPPKSPHLSDSCNFILPVFGFQGFPSPRAGRLTCILQMPTCMC